MKSSLIVVAFLVIGTVSIGLIVLKASQQAGITDAKVKVHDDLCMLVKVTLSTDEREIRRGSDLRDAIVERFGGDRIGDGADPITWCSGPFDFGQFRACIDTNANVSTPGLYALSIQRDNACMADMIAAARDRISQ